MTRTQEQATPAVQRHVIERPRLTRLLDETTARVIMLVAPAGYGKTILARQWLTNRPNGWYAASPASTDIAALGLGLIRATAELADVGQRFTDWLRTRRGSEDRALGADLLVEDLQSWPTGAWLAVDDYHQLTPEAEQLIDRLRSIEALKLILTTRRRPIWSTPRQRLYGEVYELGPSALSMSHEEADLVLGNLEESAQLIALAEGWPAVIGLASFANAFPCRSAEALPPELHAYIADELYSSVPARARTGLAQLSLFEDPSSSQAGRLLGSKSKVVIAEGARVGFLTYERTGALSIHPLLQSFLREKLIDDLHVNGSQLVSDAVEILLEDGEWEAAFDVLQRFGVPSMLDDLLRAALDELLDRGLLSTLLKFVNFGRTHRIESPLLDLAEAELAFREGKQERSKHLAELAGKRLMGDRRFAAKAYCRAGHCAYFCDDIEMARAYFERARDLAEDDGDERRAVWGLFLCGVESEHPDAARFLDEFESIAGDGVDDVLRAQNGRLHLGMRLGNLRNALASAKTVADLVSSARDPVVRASFWHIYAGSKRVVADYMGALEAADRALQEITTFDLDFARAHVYLTRAGAYAGMGVYEEALILLSTVERIGNQNGDVYVQMNERALRCRVHLLRNDMESAIRAVDVEWSHVASSGQYAEFLACRALVSLMAVTREGDPFDVLHDAEERSRENEATLLSSCVRAIAYLHGENPDAADTITRAFRLGMQKGILDPLVFAVRLEPRLASLVGQTPHMASACQDIVCLAKHGQTGRPDGSAYSRLLAGVETLTGREKEVFALVGQGKTNKEIANSLVLAESTVKVHVRHILKKLGARSRTEAAIHAVRMQQREVVEPEARTEDLVQPPART